MQVIWFLLIGVAAGFIAGKLMRGGGFGLLGNLLVGILGAVIGGFLFNLMGLAATGRVGALLTATAGAVVLLWVVRLVQ